MVIRDQASWTALESLVANHKPVWLLELQLLYSHSRQQVEKGENSLKLYTLGVFTSFWPELSYMVMCSLQKSVGNECSLLNRLQGDQLKMKILLQKKEEMDIKSKYQSLSQFPKSI